MLSDAGNDHRLSVGQAADGLHHALGLKHPLLLGIGERILLLPTFDRFHPFGVVVAHRILVEFDQNAPDIRDNAEIRPDILVDLRLVNIHMDNERVPGKGFHRPRDAVIESGSERQQKITLVRRIIRIIGSVHSEPFQGERMILRNRTDAHQRRGNRNLV